MLPNLANLSFRRQRLAVGAPLSDEVKAAILEIECNICSEKIKVPSLSWLGPSTDAGATRWTIACFNQHVFHKACLKGAWNGAGLGNERCPDCREPPAQGLLTESAGWLGNPTVPVFAAWGRFQEVQRAVTDRTKRRLREAAVMGVQPFETFVAALTVINDHLWRGGVWAGATPDIEEITRALNAFYDSEVILQRIARSASTVFDVSGDLSDTITFATWYLRMLVEAWPRFGEAYLTVNEERRSANNARSRARIFGRP